MKRHTLGWLVLTVLAMITTGDGLTVVAKADLAIPDISEWQGRLSAAQVQELKPKVAFVINRRQYGTGYVDRDATNNTNLYVRYGIPFGEYDFSQFTSASNARLEARDFYARSNKAARFYVLDFEVNTVKHGTTNAAVNAWYDQMRALTNKKLIFYSYASFATAYANQARQRFNAQWIAAYDHSGPTIPCALWQYTDDHRLPGVMTAVDNSKVITSVHPITWWTAVGNPVNTAVVQRSAVKPVKPLKTETVRKLVQRPRVQKVNKLHKHTTKRRSVKNVARQVKATKRSGRVLKSKPRRKKVRVTYYHRLPKNRQVTVRVTTSQYDRSTFNNQTRLRTKLRRGKHVAVAQIGHRTHSWYFRSKRGHYFTANRKVVAE